jgi:hypothetical protein
LGLGSGLRELEREGGAAQVVVVAIVQVERDQDGASLPVDPLVRLEHLERLEVPG